MTSTIEEQAPPLVFRTGAMVLADSDPASPGDVTFDVGQGPQFGVLHATSRLLILGREDDDDAALGRHDREETGWLKVTGAVAVWDGSVQTGHQFPMDPGTYLVVVFRHSDRRVCQVKVIRQYA